MASSFAVMAEPYLSAVEDNEWMFICEVMSTLCIKWIRSWCMWVDFDYASCFSLMSLKFLLIISLSVLEKIGNLYKGKTYFFDFSLQIQNN